MGDGSISFDVHREAGDHLRGSTIPIRVINGIRIYSESHGEGAPVVLVHGSRGDPHNWDPVVPGLARTFRTLTYDRRGHSQSERPESQGSIEEDVADLALLITTQQVARTNPWASRLAVAPAMPAPAACPKTPTTR